MGSGHTARPLDVSRVSVQKSQSDVPDEATLEDSKVLALHIGGQLEGKLLQRLPPRASFDITYRLCLLTRHTITAAIL
jgi:hypothetical protein